MNQIYYQHNDLNDDGINDAVCVYSQDFHIPLIGYFRGVEIARVLYIPSRPDSVVYAERIATNIIEHSRLSVALREAVALFENDAECNEVGTDAWAWLQRAREALLKNCGCEMP